MSKYFIDCQNKTTIIFNSLNILERIVLLYLGLQFPLSITICAKKRRISIAIGADGRIVMIIFIFWKTKPLLNI
jgi:hypothetical protein